MKCIGFKCISFKCIVSSSCLCVDGLKENTTDYAFYKFHTLTHHLEAKPNPSCSDRLKLHFSRANYRAYTWMYYLQWHPQIPPPVVVVVDARWEQWQVYQVEHSTTCTWWVLETMFCTCSKKCVSGSCPCVDNSLMCTDACTKQDCDNSW